jgi:16S rRNA processing protein RimM
MPAPTDALLVARIGKPHGLHGEVTVQLHTDDPDARFATGAVLTTKAAPGSGVPRTLTVATTRVHRGIWLIGFEQIPDRTGAESLRGTRLVIDAADLEPGGDDDAWYEDELRGLAVHTPDGARIGEVTRLEMGPAQDLLVVALDTGGDAYLPFVEAIVPEVDVVSIFPDYLAPLDLSLIGKARREGLLDVRVHDLRDFTHDRHRTVDDSPYGGGAGMVMRPEPWGEALDAVVASGDGVPHLVVPGPAGEPFTQAMARALAAEPWLTFACGRYEGIDERVVEDAATRMPVSVVSLGDYVLNGGEVAVLAIVEAVARPGPGG